MKNKIFYTKLLAWLIPIIGLLSSQSCNNEDDDMKGTTPVIELVSASVDANNKPVDPLVSTHIGYPSNTYVIKGSGFASLRHVYFNDYESTFNPNLVTDNAIIITINIKTPYVNGSNKLKLVTATGTVEYDFVIAPPSPIFNGFQSINAADGTNITLKGNYFVNPTVKVGNTDAAIVSYDLTHIVATLPAGSQGKKVSVTTLSGTVTYSSQIGTSIYDDTFSGGISNATWAGDTYDTAYSTDPANIKQGEKAIKWDVKAWSAFQIDNSPSIPSAAKGIRFYIKSTSAINNGLRLILNYSWGTTPSVSVGKEYQYVEIPWSSFGLASAPSTMNVVFNNNTGNTNTIYMDDIGYYY